MRVEKVYLFSLIMTHLCNQSIKTLQIIS